MAEQRTVDSGQKRGRQQGDNVGQRSYNYGRGESLFVLRLGFSPHQARPQNPRGCLMRWTVPGWRHTCAFLRACSRLSVFSHPAAPTRCPGDSARQALYSGIIQAPQGT